MCPTSPSIWASQGNSFTLVRCTARREPLLLTQAEIRTRSKPREIAPLRFKFFFLPQYFISFSLFFTSSLLLLLFISYSNLYFDFCYILFVLLTLFHTLKMSISSAPFALHSLTSVYSPPLSSTLL